MKAVGRKSSFSLVTLLLGVSCTIIALTYSADSSGFPRAVAILLVILAAADLLRTGGSEPGSAEVDSSLASGGDWQYHLVALLVFASAPVYVGLTMLFDFEVATFVYLVVGMYVLGIRNALLVVAVSTGVLLAVKGLFFVLLDVTRASTLIFGT